MSDKSTTSRASRPRLRSVIPRSLRSALVGISALGAVVAAAALLLLVGGYDVARGLTSLWSGAAGSWYALTSATLVRAIPLMLTGCAVAIAFRGGVLNIGAEGQLLAGATAACAVALGAPAFGAASTLVALLAGAAAGACWAGIAAALRARFGVLEVISTIMLNFLALYAVSYLVRGPLQEPTHAYPQTETIMAAVRLPHVPGAGRLHVGIVVAVVLLLASGWMLRHTAAGFRLLAVGENPSAAASAGQIDVSAVVRRAFFISGALAGVAGAVEVLGVTYALYENLSPGYGYTAIAVALLAGLDPWRVLPSAVLFGALEAGAAAMQRDAAVPATLVTVIEAVLILGAIAVQALRLRRAQLERPAPADAGQAEIIA